jgi:hypothetical protein
MAYGEMKKVNWIMAVLVFAGCGNISLVLLGRFTVFLIDAWGIPLVLEHFAQVHVIIR